MRIFRKILKGTQKNCRAIILYTNKEFFQKNPQKDRWTQWLFFLKSFIWYTIRGIRYAGLKIWFRLHKWYELTWIFENVFNNKQVFHAFLFNIRNYSPEVINIQRRKAELQRVNNFDIKQKKAWNICLITWHQHQRRAGKIKATETQQILVKKQVFLETLTFKTPSKLKL